MSVLNSCARCGAELRPQSSEGLCTRCLLERGLEGSKEEPKFPGPGHTALSPELEDRKSKIENRTVRNFGDYELLEEIARGGMGVVYRARQGKLDRLLAVKKILAGGVARPEQALRFRAEVEAAGRVEHPDNLPTPPKGGAEGH